MAENRNIYFLTPRRDAYYMKICIGSDHGGYLLKEDIKKSNYFQIIKNIFKDIISGIRINNSI